MKHYTFFVTAVLLFPAVFAVCTNVPSDIIAWWPLDEPAGPNAADIIGINPGIHVNSPSSQPGLVSNGIRFNGVNQYVGAPDSNLWAFGTNNFTIELWANFSAPGSGSVGHPGDI